MNIMKSKLCMTRDLMALNGMDIIHPVQRMSYSIV